MASTATPALLAARALRRPSSFARPKPLSGGGFQPSSTDPSLRRRSFLPPGGRDARPPRCSFNRRLSQADDSHINSSLEPLQRNTLTRDQPGSEACSATSCSAAERRSLAAFPAAEQPVPASTPLEASPVEGSRGSVLGAIALITGTSVGAGILALPLETSQAGFIPSASLLVACWAFLTLEAFLIADVNIHLLNKRRNGSQGSLDASGSDVISLRTMAEETLGPVGGWISTATYVFLSYTLVVAYIAKAADVATLGSDVPFDVAAAAFVAGLGGVVYAGNTHTTDLLNRIMTGGLLGLFCLIVFGGSLDADWSQLSSQDWAQAPGTLPVLFLSLVFHDLIPVLCTYLDGDLKRVRTAIALGSAVPLTMFLVWDAVALALSHGAAGVDPLEVLMTLGGPAQGAVIEGFSILAVMTSFLGTALSFSEFFIEQLGSLLQKAEKSESVQRTAVVAPECNQQRQATGRPSLRFSEQQMLRAAAFSLVLIPSWAIACNIPHAFFTASEAAGAYGMTVLYGVFPPLMFWKLRQSSRSGQSDPAPSEEGSGDWWDRPAGGVALASMAVCAFSVMVSQAVLDTSSFQAGNGVISSDRTSASSPVVVLATPTPVSTRVERSSMASNSPRSDMDEQLQSLTAPLVTVDDSSVVQPRLA